MKPSKLQDHLRRCHHDKTEKDLKYLQTLKDKFQKRPTLDRMFASTSQEMMMVCGRLTISRYL
ncbi:unnamed protein product [Acanthoscelides obtectus]|uniref:Uncharacterized protein n=1 Tax=Acanthoscelides obtectus TaxID=200917 RepID=A0A9P0L7B4_ACAOB|nr:unnamed protein product [Acanthoscelides obtectus]CAK1675190.1 hypothetical protein AOBTE_LOCUS30047 [Acanthoscelides obtectus]